MMSNNWQGCVVIFLSNFLALLIKVDAAGGGHRDVLGGVLVAINVLLFVTVVFATWFATHQAVVETRDGETALGVAGAVLTFEKHAAASARFTRQQTAGLLSSSSVVSRLRSGADSEDRVAGTTLAATKPSSDGVDSTAVKEQHEEEVLSESKENEARASVESS